MKFTKTFLALAFIGVLMTGCKDSGKAPDSISGDKVSIASNTEKVETARFNVEGMTCAIGCAKTIEKKLSGMDGVKNAAVDFDKKLATVTFDTSKLSPEKLAEAVETTGDGKTYKVSNMKSSGDHAMVIDPEKTKKKKKAKKTDKKEGCDMDTKAGAKPACCSAKKSCHADEKAGAM